MMDKLLEALELMNRVGDVSLPEDTWREFEQLVIDTLVPERIDGHSRPCERKDFTDFVPTIEQNLKYICSFLHEYDFSNETGVKRKLKKNTLVLLLTLIGEHVENNVWSSDECKTRSLNILENICKLCGCNNIIQLLVRGKGDSDFQDLLKPVLLSLRPKLLKDTWKSYPAAVACFYWILLYIKSPHLSDHLNSVLPTALILVDDFIPQNKLLGIKSLHHIVDNVPRTQLCWYDQAEVVYQALFKIVYYRDDLLAAPVLDTLTLLVDKIESGPGSEDRKLEWTHRDDVLQLVLQQMEMEQRLVLRTVYMKALLPLTVPLGSTLIRHARALTRVLSSYLEVAVYDDPLTTLCAIKMVHIFCSQCEPRLPVHAPRLVAALLRLLADVHGAGPTRPQSFLAEQLGPPAAFALRQLLAAAPHLAAELVAGLLPAPPQATPALTVVLEEVLASFAKVHAKESSEEIVNMTANPQGSLDKSCTEVPREEFNPPNS